MTLDDECAVLARIPTDPEAFGEIFDAYYPVIIKYLVRRTGSYAVAEDLASITFVRALTRIDSFQPKGVSILAWLYRIAGNALKDHYRSSARLANEMPDELLELLSSPDTTDEVTVLQEKLDRQRDFAVAVEKLHKLPLKYQEVISLHYLEGLKIREIAIATNKQTGTVKSLLSRGMKLLQKTCNQPQFGALYMSGGTQHAAPREYYET